VKNFHEAVPLGSQSFGSECETTETSTFHIEYYCRVTDHDLAMKQKTALLASSLTIFTVLTLYAVSWFAKNLVRINNVEWDLQTRTAADYTLEIPISSRQCNEIARQELTEEDKQRCG
jgi:hypothetical protein